MFSNEIKTHFNVLDNLCHVMKNLSNLEDVIAEAGLKKTGSMYTYCNTNELNEYITYE